MKDGFEGLISRLIQQRKLPMNLTIGQIEVTQNEAQKEMCGKINTMDQSI